MGRKKFRLLAAAAALCLWGCSAQTDTPSKTEPEKNPPLSQSGQQQTGKDPSSGPSGELSTKTPYQAPPFAGASFHEEASQGENGVRIDLSQTAKGYVAALGESESRLKFQVLKGDSTYTYDLPSDGVPAVFPLQSGDGAYTFRVMEHVAEGKYAPLYSVDCDVALEDEFAPFLRPNQYTNYNEDSLCVKEAAKIASEQPGALEVVSAVLDYVCERVTYDKEKALTVESGYLPNPDETLATGKGICFDYASLTAAMLRSQGIPTKMVFGYVQPDDLYHAWNMFYTEESGWVTVEYQVESGNWARLDLTFAANGGDSQFIGNGENYADVYFY